MAREPEDPRTDEDMRRRLSDIITDHMYGLTGAPWDDDYTRARALCTTLAIMVRGRSDYWKPRVADQWRELVASDVMGQLCLDETLLAEYARLVERWIGFPPEPGLPWSLTDG